MSLLLSSLSVLFWSGALLGHVACCVAIVNHLHAQGWPRAVIKGLTWPMRLVTLIVPALLAWGIWQGSISLQPSVHGSSFTLAATAYALVGWSYLLGIVLPHWISRLVQRLPTAILSERTQRHDLSTVAGDDAPPTWKGRLFARLPGNEAWQLDVTELTLELPNLAPELDGLVLVQATDWHFTGRVRRAYFEEVVRHINRCEADFVMLCGDLIEKEACRDWIPHTFARLRSRYGTHFVLGNHDTWIDHERTRRDLQHAGLIDLGRQVRSVEIDGRSIVLAGNELPWIGPALDPTTAFKSTKDNQPLKILLSHSPDQFPWAKRHGFDLMLAGHTHGGQIRFPLVGATVCPSRYGVRYACGTFYEPPTLAHVSRGVSGLTPLRWNCAPEITRLVLRCPTARRPATEQHATVDIHAGV